jgi:hypothetical protein
MHYARYLAWLWINFRYSPIINWHQWWWAGQTSAFGTPCDLFKRRRICTPQIINVIDGRELISWDLKIEKREQHYQNHEKTSPGSNSVE